MNKKGIVLIAVIIIIVALSLVALGITVYISEALRDNASRLNQSQALYMAQAGVMRAIVDYQDGGSWDSAQNENVEGEFYYHVGGQDSNFLLIDASSPQISGKKLRQIPLTNTNASNSITITDIEVSWNFSRNLKKVKLAGSTVWTGTESSPANLDITDTTLPASTAYSGNEDQMWKFSGNIPTTGSEEVVVTFTLSDGSSFKTYLLKNGAGANSEFKITSTGQIGSGSSVKARRTLVVTYDTGTSEITSWQESQQHIIP